MAIARDRRSAVRGGGGHPAHRQRAAADTNRLPHLGGPSGVLALQQMIGNAATAKLARGTTGTRGAPSPTVKHGGAAPGQVQRSLIRDRVFSDAEFVSGMPAARQGGTEVQAWTTLVTSLAKLETGHTDLARIKARLANQDPSEQTWGRRTAKLKLAMDKAKPILADIPGIITMAENLMAAEEEKMAGVGGKVKGVFKGKTSKRAKASRLDQIRTLLIQLQRRLPQVRAENEQFRFDLVNLQKQQINSETEGPEQKKAAAALAKQGAFGAGQGEVKDASFGAGAMGSVAQVDYKDAKGGVFKGVFKAEPDRFGANDGGMRALGANENSPNLSMRSVAASKLNELLGMKVIPHTELAFHDQFGFGQVMALAGGRSPKTTVKTEIKETDPAKIARIESLLKEEEAKSDGHTKLVQKQGASGEVKRFLEETVTFETDWDHPILKRELASLQLMDGLIGNIDRHCENYFIQVDALGSPVGILGIDNDLTFAREQNDPAAIAMMQGHSAGLPPAVDKFVAEKFCAVTADQVRAAVKGLLTGLEVETLIVRLQSIQQKLAAKNDKGAFVIPRIANDLEGAKQWTEVKDPKNVKGAYFARERAWQQGPMKEQGRLLKSSEALSYKEDRLWELVKKASAGSAVDAKGDLSKV